LGRKELKSYATGVMVSRKGELNFKFVGSSEEVEARGYSGGLLMDR